MWHSDRVRRLTQHAIAGVGFAAVVASAAVFSLGSPVEQDTAIAVPAPVTSVAAPSTDPSPVDLAAQEAAVAAERSARASRDAERIKLVAATTAKKRASTLGKQGKSIDAQGVKLKAKQAKLKAERARLQAERAAADAKAKADAAAKAKAAAAAAAAKTKAAAAEKAKVRSNRGYTPGTGDPREIARQILKNKYNYGDNQYACFNNIIIRESNWQVNATNPSSGAYGIPQSLPGSKMATIASDWRTNPATQIIWGIEYMKKRYGSPCGAWGFKSSHGWY